jgi:hypothetical protein
MVEEKQENCVCCEELDERKGTVEYGFEEPSEAVVNPGEPDKPRITHMSGVKPERKKLGFLWKVVIAGVMVVITLVLGYYLMATG